MSRKTAPSSTVATEKRTDRPSRRPTKKHRFKVTSLMYAAQQGDIDNVKEIVNKKISALYDRDRTGKTPLHYCCNSNNICAAQGADIIVMAAPDLVNGKDEDGFTALHLAVIAGNMQLVTFLLANDADVNAVDNEKHTVVHWATVCGETTALRAVLAAGASVSTPDIHGGYPLHYAAQMCGGDRESPLGLQVLQVLLNDRNIFVSVCDSDKRQPLLWAASAGSTRAVLALIKAGANVEAADKDGLTALHCAASRGHTDCMETLLTLCGASVDVIDTNGCTALHYAVTLGHADATTLLLEHGADPNRQDRKGRSPAHCGCAKGQFETVKLLGTHKANLWLRNARGDLPLHDAAASGRRDLVKWLLELKPSLVDARNNDGRCPLHMAALHDNSDMCKILLDAGAQVNQVFRTSKNIFMTPLDCALQRGFRSTAKYLQVHGGVPASRLRDLSTRSNMVSMTREETNLLGDSSTDSEREDGTAEKRSSNRKTKFSRYERKNMSRSESDRESIGLESKRQHGLNSERRPNSLSNKAESAGYNANMKTPSSLLDYTGEIIINGRTEINIRHSGKIYVNEEKKEPTEISDRNVSPSVIERDRRPRSAKYNRLKEKSSRRNIDHSKNIRNEKSISETIIQQETLKPHLKDQSTNTSDRAVDIIEENEKLHYVTRTINGESTSQEDGMQDSMNIEVTKELKNELVVEVNVHAPPKSSANDTIQHEDSVVAPDVEKPPGGVEVHEIDRMDTPSDSKYVDEAPSEKNLIEDKFSNGANGDICDSKIDYREPEPSVMETNKLQALAERIENHEELASEELPDPSSGDTMKRDIGGEKVECGMENLKEKICESQKENEKGENDVDEKTCLAMNENGKEHHEQISGTDRTVECLPVLDAMENAADMDPIKINETLIEEDCGHMNERKSDMHGEVTVEPETLTVVMTGDNTGIDLMKRVEMEETMEQYSDLSDGSAERSHRSFRILDEEGVDELKNHMNKEKQSRSRKKDRSLSGSVGNKSITPLKNEMKISRIPKPLFMNELSKSDKRLNDMQHKSKDSRKRDTSLPNLYDDKGISEVILRSDSNMSAPLQPVLRSDDAENSSSGLDESRDLKTKSKKFIKKRSRTREVRSAGSDYESSNLMDSGFEPSPRSTRVPKWKNMTDRSVNMTSVTQSIQNNIRRYHLERKIFQQLLDLKRNQIRAGQHNESVLVKRAIDAYHQSCASSVGSGRYIPQDYTFKSFERFLYEALRKLQKNGADYLRGLPASTQANPLLCTRSTNRCMHAAHAYTGVPCAAYLPKMDHHSIPKIGFNSVGCNPGTRFLPNISSKKSVTLELSHGNDKQIISLPTERLDENKRYYVTFTVKGHEGTEDKKSNKLDDSSAHRHSRSN